MARRARTAFRELKKHRPDVYDAMKEMRGIGSATKGYNYLRRRVKPVTPLKELRGMARRASFRSGTPIKINKDMGEGHRIAVAQAIRENDKVEVRLHPILQYYDRRFVTDAIGHELDHVRVYKRSIRRQKARQKKKKHGYY